MSTPSPKMGLTLPTTTDRFSTSELRSNWEKIDASPGTFICTSSTRPAWGSSQAGRQIYETNTNLTWTWTGTAWTRTLGGTGLLKLGTGTNAVAERTTDFETFSESFVRILTLTGVVVPDGRRPLMLAASWDAMENTGSTSYVAIFRSASNNSGPILARTQVISSTAGAGPGGQILAFERDGLAAGSYDFSLQVRVVSASANTKTRVQGSALAPIQLTVVEL